VLRGSTGVYTDDTTSLRRREAARHEREVGFRCRGGRVVKFRLICFTVLIASLRKKKNNVLRLLLTLECMVLFLFIFICFLGETYFGVIFLSVGACEAAVGLGCLVGLIRLVGQNHISFTECGHYWSVDMPIQLYSLSG